MAWLQINNSDFLTDEGRKMLADTVTVEGLQEMRLMDKNEFFEVFLLALAEFRREAESRTSN